MVSLPVTDSVTGACVSGQRVTSAGDPVCEKESLWSGGGAQAEVSVCVWGGEPAPAAPPGEIPMPRLASAPFPHSSPYTTTLLLPPSTACFRHLPPPGHLPTPSASHPHALPPQTLLCWISYGSLCHSPIPTPVPRCCGPSFHVHGRVLSPLLVGQICPWVVGNSFCFHLAVEEPHPDKRQTDPASGRAGNGLDCGATAPH